MMPVAQKLMVETTPVDADLPLAESSIPVREGEKGASGPEGVEVMTWGCPQSLFRARRVTTVSSR